MTRRLGKHLYVAFNTLIFDDEWPRVEDELDFLEDLRPDAVIVQDLGLLKTLRDRGSTLPRHLSTQAAWDGAGGTSLLQDLGVERVILPRETSIAEMARLADESPFEIEVFVHGAHCYGVSGRCHWSIHLGPRSGNRGTCAQPCRRSYVADDGKASAFSPRDLRTIGRLSELTGLGIAAFKIEGRLKNARTIRRVVAAYRAVMDSNAMPEEVAEDLDLAFSRQWCEGFLDGAPPEWRTDGPVGHVGLRMGRVVQPVSASGKAVVQAERPIRTGMGLSWNEADGLRDGRRGDKVVWTSGEVGRIEVRFRTRGPSRKDTVLYATASASEEDPCAGWDESWEREAVRLRFAGRVGQELTCEFEVGGRSGAVRSDRCLEPSKGGGVESVIRDKFGSLGGGIAVDRIDLSAVDPCLFVPPSSMKTLRRNLLESLAAEEPRSPEARRRAASPEPVIEPCETFAYAIRVYQEGLVGAMMRSFSPPLGWVLPLAVATGPGAEARRGASYWIPPCYGLDSTRALDGILGALPDSDFLCAAWEAFDLARRFPRHRFAVEGTFNLTNSKAAEVVRGAGVGLDDGIESPRPLRDATQCLRVNPLVTVSRFPQPPGAPARWFSDRGDILHLYPLGRAVGTFLERWPEIPDLLTPSMRVDVFVPPGTDLQAFVDRLGRWLDTCAVRRRSS